MLPPLWIGVAALALLVGSLVILLCLFSWLVILVNLFRWRRHGQAHLFFRFEDVDVNPDKVALDDVWRTLLAGVLTE